MTRGLLNTRGFGSHRQASPGISVCWADRDSPNLNRVIKIKLSVERCGLYGHLSKVTVVRMLAGLFTIGHGIAPGKEKVTWVRAQRLR